MIITETEKIAKRLVAHKKIEDLIENILFDDRIINFIITFNGKDGNPTSVQIENNKKTIELSNMIVLLADALDFIEGEGDNKKEKFVDVQGLEYGELLERFYDEDSVHTDDPAMAFIIMIIILLRKMEALVPEIKGISGIEMEVSTI